MNQTSIISTPNYTNTISISHRESDPFLEIYFTLVINSFLPKDLVLEELILRPSDPLTARFILDKCLRDLFLLQSVQRLRENPSLESKLMPWRWLRFAWLYLRKLEKR